LASRCKLVTNEEVLRRVNEDRQKVHQQHGEKEFKCYMIWQMMMAMLHANGQLRTEKDGDTEKNVKNLLYSRRLLIMVMMMSPSGPCVSTRLRYFQNWRAAIDDERQFEMAMARNQLSVISSHFCPEMKTYNHTVEFSAFLYVGYDG